MEKTIPKFFLSANSAEGFLSFFESSYDINKGWHAYILKGGPGTGKSSFMKKLGEKAQEKNIEYELIFCSSDPNSLDGIIFPKLKKIILDGTNPHLVTPKYPGAYETELNLSLFWNNESLVKNKEKIANETNKNKAFHKAASLYLRAAGQPIKDNFELASKFLNEEKAIRFAEKTAKNNIPKLKSQPKEWKRFINGSTPFGEISFKDSLCKIYNHIIIEDEYGTASSLIFEYIREFALKNNHEIITLKNHILPSFITEGIIIPSLNLCFLRKLKCDKISNDTRIIHSSRFYKEELLSKYKHRIKLGAKLSKEFSTVAYNFLNKALETHNKTEAYYINSMDFKKLDKYTNAIIKEILQ